MGKSNTEQLKIAQKYLGQGGARFRKYCGLPNGAAWCDAFVTYVFNEAGNASLFCNGKKQTYCPTTIKLLAKDMAQVPMYLAMPSDVIFFDWERNGVPNHIGFVRSKVSTSSINTTEGNTSNKVMNKTRPSKYVQAIYRPHFRPTTMPTKGKVSTDGNFEFQSIYMLQVVLNITPDAILGKGTVSALQRKAGLSGKAVDGAWGPTTSRAIQSKLLGFKGKDVDGVWGPGSTVALQKWINSQYNPTASAPTPAPAPTPTPKPTPTVTASTYPGAFPSIPKAKIIECTRSVNGMRTHGLLSGDYTLRFKSEERRYKMCKFSLATVSNKKISYSNHPKFEDKIKTIGYNLAKVRTIKTSANCSNFVDGAVGAVTGKFVRDLGAKHNKSYLVKTNYFNSLKYSKSTLLAGDICGTPKHTWMIIQGAYLSIGCEGAEVKKLQNFLNWAGFNCGKVDGDFGMGTLKAVKAFQAKCNIAQDGIVGSGTIARMKTYKK